MAENPPLNRIYVLGYSANDRDYPIVSLNADPRVAGYKVPEDLSTCPDKRYPNHVFTGAQPLSGDERVRHVWEILPSPWVPFTRYDDDLGPVQGRRRSVKNEGQVAIREADKQVTYEAREGSAIVYTELEETWSIATDDDGNSLFPVRDRDFYDPSRGPVQERRQLFVPTGEEEGSLENVNGVITQTSYEPYNEFLSVKIVQTYKVDGPQLIGKATDNDGQLVTVTTQRKGALDYIPPAPTATRTVEVSREDAESLVERIVDTPEIFKANTFSVERPDPIPQKFRVAVPIRSSQEVVEGTAQQPALTQAGEISKSEEQRNKFIKRISSTSRDQAVLPKTLTGKTTNNERQEVTVTETLQKGDTDEAPTATTTIESEALGDGNYVITKTEVPEVFSALTLSRERPDPVPQKFRVLVPTSVREENLAGTAQQPTLASGEISKSEQQVNQFVKRVATASRDSAQLPRFITQKVTTNEGLLANVTETLQTGDTTAVPTATKSVQSEALGDGTYVVTVTDLPKIFEGKTFSTEKPDNIPTEFRAEIPEETNEFNVAGIATKPTLAPTDIAKSEQQITEFVKRVRTTSRTNVGNVNLDGEQIDQDGVKVGVKRTLSKAAQTITPSATVRGQVENLGGGFTIKTELTRAEVFNEPTFSVEKPEVIPAAFRANIKTTTTEQTIEGQATEPILNQNDVSKTERQIDKFLKRTTTVSRPPTISGQLIGQQIENDGISSTVTRTIARGPQTVSPSATVSGSVENIGDGLTIKTEIAKEKIFDAQTFSQEKPDNIPVEFRAEKPITIKEITAQGEAKEVSLANNEISKSEQQVTEFLKRTRIATRDVVEGVTLEGGLQIDQDGVLSTVVRTLAKGGQSLEPSALVSGSVENIGDGKTIKTLITKGKTFDQRQNTISQTVQIPAKFIDREQEQESFVEENESAEPESLGDGGFGVVESSAQRITDFTVRKTQRTISGVNNLTEKQINNSGQEIIIESSISDDPEIETGPTIEISRSQAIGGGKFLKEIGKVEEVFDGKQETLSQPVQIPAKFFNEKITETSIIEEGTEAVPEEIGTNGFGITQSSAQRLNAFVVRKTKTEQSGVTNVLEKQTNEFKQVVDVESEIVDTPQVNQSEINGKTEFVRVQSIGGNKFVKETGTVSSVFEQKTFTQEKPDTIPAKFRTQIQQVVEEKTEETDQDIRKEDSDLEENELSKRVQQIEKNKKRTIKVFRDFEPKELIGRVFTSQLNGGVADVNEEIFESSSTPTLEKPELGTVSSEIESIGDNKFVKRVTKLPEIEVLKGAIYDEQFDVQIPFTRSIISSQDNFTYLESAEISPTDSIHSVKTTFDKDQIRDILLNKHIRSAETVNISLPDVLEDIEIFPLINSIEPLEADEQKGITLNINVVVDIDYKITALPKIKSGYNGPAEAVKHIFFLREEDSTIVQVLSKTGSSRWPIFNPQPVTVLLRINKTRDILTFQRSLPDNYIIDRYKEPISDFFRIEIPPTLHQTIDFSSDGGNALIARPITIEEVREGSIIIFPRYSRTLVATASYSILENSARNGTGITKVPSGNYLYDVSITPYRYGLVQVEAITVNLGLYA